MNLRLFFRLLLGGLVLLAASSSNAATENGALKMEVITAYNLVVDSNVTSASTNGPTAAHLGIRVTNTGATALTNVVVNIGNKTANTPGVFPSRTILEADPLPYAGTFALNMPGGADDAVRVIPSISAGETVTAYFFITYPVKDASNRSLAGAASKVSDDLWLNYDMWVTADGSLAVDQTTKVTMRNEISAMANKVSPNTTAKVPQEYLDTFNLALGWRPQDGTPRIPGALMTEGIWYDFGNVGAGFDNNGDLVPDRNAWVQPVGVASLWNPAYARLVKAYGVIIVKLNDGTERIIPFEDRLYFENIPANNTGAVGFVFYEYMPLTSGTQVSISPYQEVASGYDNEKFNGDFGSGVTTLPIPAPSLTFTKTAASSTVSPGSNATFQIAATNTGSTTLGQPSLGLPFVIEDEIPSYASGVRYVAGSASASNTIPSGRSLSISFYNGSTWSTTEPTASTVTKIRWTLQGGGFDPSTTLQVQLQANVPSNFGFKNLVNTAIAKTGSTGQLASSTKTIFVQGINSIGNLVWLDTNRDGVQDGTEAGISGVKVSLYYDADGDGVLDSSDPLYDIQDTDASATALSSDSSNYLFTSLPDGKYLAIVDYTDAQLPTGAIIKAGTSFAKISVDLDSTSINSSAVSTLTADWPFIVPLAINKRVSPSVYDEGDLVTYYIDMENWASPVPALQVPSQTAYLNATTETAGTSTTLSLTPARSAQTALNASGSADNSYARIDFAQAADSLQFNSSGNQSAWDIPIDPTTISNVKLVVRGYVDKALTDDDLELRIHTNLTTAGGTFSENAARTQQIAESSLNTALGVPKNFEFTLYNLSPASGFSYTLAQLKAMRFLITNKKTGANDGARFWLDSVGLVVTTQTSSPSAGSYGDYTFLRLPLTDTYNASQLEFVSAVPQPTSTTPAGTLTWADLGAINPGVRRTVQVTMRALNPSAGSQQYTNTVESSGGTMVSGTTINTATDSEIVTITRKGEIGNFIWWDKDSDGVQDLGEPGLANVLVSLNNGARIYTDETGYYLFTGLDDGSYTVIVHDQAFTDATNPEFSTTNTLPFSSFSLTYDPDGVTAQTRSAVTITGNSSNLTQDFGYNSVQNIISGNIFTDNNGDGDQDTGENHISGLTVQLYNGATLVATTTTDTTGFYQFGALANNSSPGYTITVTPPSNTTQTLDPFGPNTSPYSNSFTLSASGGNIYPNNDFAYKPTGSFTLGDTLYTDWNGDGSQGTGENGIPNITVKLYEDSNGDGLIDSSTDSLIATTATDGSGFYQFTSLLAGSYRVVVDTTDTDFPSGLVQIQDYDGVRDSRASVVLSGNLSTVDFGYQPSGSGSIGDKVFIDGNNNATENSGESGIANVTVRLYFDSNGNNSLNIGTDVLVSTTATDTSGNYLFPSLPAGTYIVDVDQTDLDIPANHLQTTSDPKTVALAAAQSYLLADFGFAASGTIGDTVYYDLNRNGSQDWNETGISGVTVKLYAADGSGAPTGSVLATTTTDSSGFYQFTGLVAGSYAVVVDKAGSAPISSLALTGDPDRDGVSTDVSYAGLPSGDNTDSSIALSAGATYLGGDFGYAPSNVVGDYVWLDLDKDGVQDAGEIGLANVELTLFRASDSSTITVYSDFDGKWNSTLTDGSWTLTVASSNFSSGGALEGFTSTCDADGGISSPSNVIAFTVTSGVVNLAAGNLGLDFGYGYTSGSLSLSGTVVTNDAGSAGTADAPATEFELAGQVVYLSDSAGKILTNATTNSNGDYSFSGLIPSTTYYVTLGTANLVLEQATLTTTSVNANAINTEVTAVLKTSSAVKQTVVMASSNVTNVDFAFTSAPFDMGDLPASYAITSLAQDGARHSAPAGGFTKYLGSSIDSEVDASEGSAATGDDTTGSDDENGVTANFNSWQDGVHGGHVTVSVTGGGWLLGWVDLNGDGDFLDSGETVVNQSVSAGNNQFIQFDINDAINIESSSYVYSRFRLFATQPLYPAVSYLGLAENGEVEDYKFIRTANVSISGDVLQDIYRDGSDFNPIADVTLTLKVWNGSAYVDYDSDAVTGGIQPTTTTTDATGYYEFLSLPAGTYRVVETQPSGYLTYFEKKEGVDDGSVDDQITGIELATSSSTSASNNFYEVLMACPNLWSGWQTKWSGLGVADVTYTGNSDGDIFSNLLEYAFCLSPKSGAGSGYCLVRSETDATGKVDLVYSRTAGGATDVAYELQYTTTLSQSTSWTTSAFDIETASSNVVITYNANGTETVRVKDIESRTGLSGGQGFVRISISLTDGLNTPVAHSEVAGWTESPLNSTCRTCNTPYVSCPVFSGTVSSVSGQQLTTTSSGGGSDLSTLITSASYLEITSGAYEGHRFDIGSAGVDTFTLSTGGNSTLAELPAGLGTPTFVVRTHHTFGSLFPAASFTPSDDSTTASNLQLFSAGNWTGYWLNDSSTDKWVLSGDGTLAERSSVIVPAGHAFFIQSPVASAATFLTFGKVRENDFIRPLPQGASLVGGGYPVLQSSAGTDGRAMSFAANAFVGTLNFKTADQFLTWKGDVTNGASGYDTYYLLQRNSAYKWVKVGDANLAPQDSAQLFSSDRGTFLDLEVAKPLYKVPAPWLTNPQD